ncbi:type II toxin-antitoxin system Phd/YefM family antitoxin [Amycolatopsis alkalitolerans]|uniref:Antitoxin n=1 Tax=Amycolatopsis alkalitolerans TaxID=2547244 RepID=A0A5C4M360_9PSEU|nr:type II toxin-antitoxin system Phd/YefM family antitoxin [Amycolatopsis alkalitolerans]TNC25349.1 type II toxin-antitoxin system Phd/YefM family antitoxin [Amycolatopsis alkalitolerans]
MTAAYELGDDATEVPVSDVREHLADLLDLVDRTGRRVYVTKRGRRVGALVPVADAERSEAEEDAYWGARAARVMESGEPTVPWDEALRRLETGAVDE